jgi:glyoxylase-like metal-dependent hydrolase (beta-lactamase superfamily II)
MIITTVMAGVYDANCYIVMDEESREAVILDPGGDGPKIEQIIDEMGAKIKSILLTHGHFDHVGGVEYLADKYKVPFYINKNDEELMERDSSVYGSIRKADIYLEDGDILTFGQKTIKVIHTPGHSKGGVSFLIDDACFTGDTLFQGSIGRTDFLGGDFKEIINSIKTKLLPLGDNVQVYPGHGPSSTIAFEKERNPYLE